MRLRRIAVILACSGALCLSAIGEGIRIAAASNLQFVMPALVDAFRAEYPEAKVSVSHAASGNLVAQIRHGAPFDLLMAADTHYPQALIESGHAESQSLFVFAHGILVLWPQPQEQSTWQEILADSKLNRLAIAHPEIAPYGQAAQSFLKHHGLWENLRSRIVTGENAAQTLQFVQSGNADVGFVAASLLVRLPDSRPGIEFDLGEAALPHGAVRLTKSKRGTAADRFLTWLAEDEAVEILRDNGYRVP